MAPSGKLSGISKSLNALTFVPPGFKRSITVNFPEGKLPVCKACKSFSSTRDACRLTKGHVDAPWSTSWVCILTDTSVVNKTLYDVFPDADGEARDFIFNDGDYSVMDLNKSCKFQAFFEGSFEANTPVCLACKNTNRTKNYCRTKHNHGQVPWNSSFAFVSLKDKFSQSQDMGTPELGETVLSDGTFAVAVSHVFLVEISADKVESRTLTIPQGSAMAQAKMVAKKLETSESLARKREQVNANAGKAKVASRRKAATKNRPSKSDDVEKALVSLQRGRSTSAPLSAYSPSPFPQQLYPPNGTYQPGVGYFPQNGYYHAQPIGYNHQQEQQQQQRQFQHSHNPMQQQGYHQYQQQKNQPGGQLDYSKQWAAYYAAQAHRSAPNPYAQQQQQQQQQHQQQQQQKHPFPAPYNLGEGDGGNAAPPLQYPPPPQRLHSGVTHEAHLLLHHPGAAGTPPRASSYHQLYVPHGQAVVNSFSDTPSNNSPAIGGVGGTHGQSIDPFSLFNQIYPTEEGGVDGSTAAPIHGNLQSNLTKSESSDRLATIAKG
mmetsp:Transcript_20245/g.40529  ORF Transcript_20245/g.40529 Transcript_20245/m.40529 type:complete len:545 (+) Transcript_20245:173-1807(+)